MGTRGPRSNMETSGPSPLPPHMCLSPDFSNSAECRPNHPSRDGDSLAGVLSVVMVIASYYIETGIKEYLR